MDSHNSVTRELTRAELQIMQIIWNRSECFVNDIIEDMAEPKPAYNTVSTIVRILEKKGFVGHRSYGKSHCYYTLISREEYTSGYMSSVLNNFFDNSLSQMVSFFASNEKISLKEMNQIMEVLKQQSDNKK